MTFKAGRWRIRSRIRPDPNPPWLFGRVHNILSMGNTAASYSSPSEDNSDVELKKSFNEFKKYYLKKFLPYLPFLPMYIINKWPKHVPELWVQSYKLFSASLWDLVILAAYWGLYKILGTGSDLVLSVCWKAGIIAFIGVIVSRHARELAYFLIFPASTSNESAALPNLEEAIKGYIIRNVPRVLLEANMKKAHTPAVLVSVFLAFLTLGKSILKEVLVRIDVVLLSIRFLLFSALVILFYAGLYDYVFSLYGGVAFNSIASVSFWDFMVYSFGVFTTADFGGVSPASLLIRLCAVSELCVAIVCVSMVLPLIVFSYERALDYYRNDLNGKVGKPSAKDKEFVEQFVKAIQEARLKKVQPGQEKKG